MFDTAINPDREKNQYVSSLRELGDDALLMLLAGTDTTANTLVRGTWELMSNPNIYERLRAELLENRPDKGSRIPAAKLETLPYLVSVYPTGGAE